MSSAGIYADVYDQTGTAIGPCLLIGDLVPRIHHSDGVPVYFVTQHAGGPEISFRTGAKRHLLAYPAGWPAPGESRGRYVYAHHERLPWDAPVPLHDEPEEVPEHGRHTDELH